MYEKQELSHFTNMRPDVFLLILMFNIKIKFQTFSYSAQVTYVEKCLEFYTESKYHHDFVLYF